MRKFLLICSGISMMYTSLVFADQQLENSRTSACENIYAHKRRIAIAATSGLVVGGAAVVGASVAAAVFYPPILINEGLIAAGLMDTLLGAGGLAMVGGGIYNAVKLDPIYIMRLVRESRFVFNKRIGFKYSLRKFVEKKVNFDSLKKASIEDVAKAIAKGINGDFCPGGEYKILSNTGVLKYVRNQIHGENNQFKDDDFIIKLTSKEQAEILYKAQLKHQQEREEKDKRKHAEERAAIGL